MKNQETPGAALNFDICPECMGTGYKLVLENGYEVAAPCEKCREKRRMQDNTGVPPQFSDAVLGGFGFDSYSRGMENLKKISEDFLKNYKDRWEKAGKGLYLWSETPGSGKTFLSCCIGRSVMLEYDLQMRFITAPDYLAKIAESYNQQAWEYDKSEVYRRCRFLIFDDIGAQKEGGWQDQEIFRLVNTRMNNGRITIFTSNTSPENLKIDRRIIDRIIKKSIVLQMPEESIRLKEAKEEQECFLRGII